jgi:hypothetical protein
MDEVGDTRPSKRRMTLCRNYQKYSADAFSDVCCSAFSPAAAAVKAE